MFIYLNDRFQTALQLELPGGLQRRRGPYVNPGFVTRQTRAGRRCLARRRRTGGLVGASIAGFAGADLLRPRPHPERAASFTRRRVDSPTKRRYMRCLGWREAPLLSLSTSTVPPIVARTNRTPQVRQFAQATRFRAAGYQAAATRLGSTFEKALGEVGVHAASSPSLSSSSTGGRGSRRELATVATRSSLAVRTRMPDNRGAVRSRRAIDQPEVVVDAISDANSPRGPGPVKSSPAS